MEEMTMATLAMVTYLLEGLVLLGAPFLIYKLLVSYLNTCWEPSDDDKYVG